MSPTQRTMKLLRDQGPDLLGSGAIYCQAGPHGKRIDLFNIIDIIALTAHSTIGIQSCGSDFTAHLEKLMVEKADETITWLNGPRELHFYGWRRIKMKRGGKALRWKPRIAVIKLKKDEIMYAEL